VGKRRTDPGRSPTPISHREAEHCERRQAAEQDQEVRAAGDCRPSRPVRATIRGVASVGDAAGAKLGRHAARAARRRTGAAVELSKITRVCRHVRFKIWTRTGTGNAGTTYSPPFTNGAPVDGTPQHTPRRRRRRLPGLTLDAIRFFPSSGCA